VRSEDSIKEKIDMFENIIKDIEICDAWDTKEKKMMTYPFRSKIELLNWVLEKED
jgi:hypothetical protein